MIRIHRQQERIIQNYISWRTMKNISLRPLCRALCLSSVALLAACSSLSPTTLSLDQKLERQQQRFDFVQQQVIQRYTDESLPLAQRFIVREEWDKWLTPQAHEQFSEEDKQQLLTHFKQDIQASRQQAARHSLIDLDKVRALPQPQALQYIQKMCAAMPKGGMLHIHPWGSLTPETFQASLERTNPVIDVATLVQQLSNPQGRARLYPEELAWLRSLPQKAHFLSWQKKDRERFVALSVLPSGVHSFERFEGVFRILATAIGDSWDNLSKSYDDFMQRAVNAGVSYVEFTEHITPEQIDQYEALAQRLEQRYGVVVRFNNAFFRTQTNEDLDKQVQAMLQAGTSPHIIGVDLLANETDTPALEKGQVVYGAVLAAVKRKGATWRRTMHAGELGADYNPRDALLLGAERLGHGVRLINDPLTLQYARTKAIPIEINLTSNLKLGAVPDLQQHPFLTYLRLGLPVSLSTDDEGVFATDINQECELAASKTDVTYYELKEMAKNSIRTAFVDDKTKAALLDKLAQQFTTFERQFAAPVKQ